MVKMARLAEIMDTEIKPCPYCGQSMVLDTDDVGVTLWRCAECGNTEAPEDRQIHRESDSFFPEISQPADLGGACTGAKSSTLSDPETLANEIWGESEQDDDSCLSAFAYLWRRFGPPFSGSDDYKDICRYILTTPDKQVFLTITICPGSLNRGVGYLVQKSLYAEFMAPASEWYKKTERWFVERNPSLSGEKLSEAYFNWLSSPQRIIDVGNVPLDPLPDENWRGGSEIMIRVNTALLTSMKELLRPVWVRDEPINVFGLCEDKLVASLKSADYSKYAGCAIPAETMNNILKEAIK